MNRKRTLIVRINTYLEGASIIALETIIDILRRESEMYVKHGNKFHENIHEDNLQEAYEEVLDALQYLRAEKERKDEHR